jgi:xylan 1,4-beta-xylosidase
LGKPARLEVELTGLGPNVSVVVETLDQSHGNAMNAWEALGQPERPTREQTAALRQQAEATKRETLRADASGRFVLTRLLDPWSIALIREVRAGVE